MKGMVGPMGHQKTLSNLQQAMTAAICRGIESSGIAGMDLQST